MVGCARYSLWLSLLMISCISWSYSPFHSIEDAVVITAKAPMHIASDHNSEVVQWAYQGQIVKIHSEFQMEESPQSPREKTSFYRTIDHMGSVAYIPANTVYVYFRNKKEVREAKLLYR